MSERDLITPAQIKMLIATGRRRGFDVDAIRAMTPAGSLRKLTRAQAHQLIDQMQVQPNGDRVKEPRRRRPKGVHAFASDAQREYIDSVRLDMGWSPEHLADWLAARHFADGRPLSEFASSRDAAEVIELLKHVRDRSRK